MFIVLLPCLRRKDKLSDEAQMNLDLSRLLSVCGADGLVNDDLFHECPNHVVGDLRAVAVFPRQRKELLCAVGLLLSFSQLRLFCDQAFLQLLFFLFVESGDLFKPRFRDAPQRIIVSVNPTGADRAKNGAESIILRAKLVFTDSTEHSMAAAAVQPVPDSLPVLFAEYGADTDTDQVRFPSRFQSC